MRDNLFILKSEKGLFKLDVSDIQNPNCQIITSYDNSVAYSNSIEFKIIDNSLFLYTEYLIGKVKSSKSSIQFLRKVEIPLVIK